LNQKAHYAGRQGEEGNGAWKGHYQIRRFESFCPRILGCESSESYGRGLLLPNWRNRITMKLGKEDP